MPAPRPFALIGTRDQWGRCAHVGTEVYGDAAQLAWVRPVPEDKPSGTTPSGAGLAFDSHCRLFHSVPEEGRVERILWAATDPLLPAPDQPAPSDLFDPPHPEEYGDFTGQSVRRGPGEPRGLAVDADDLLYVADAAGRCVWVFDLDTRRTLRRVPVPGRPVDLAADGRGVYAALESPPGVAWFTRSGGPLDLALPVDLVAPARLAVSRGGVPFVLEHAGTPQARVFPLRDGLPPKAVPHATDLEFAEGEDGAEVLVVARRGGEPFARYCLADDTWTDLTPLRARGYDGRGIVRTPDGRIGFWAGGAFRHAVAARVAYAESGEVVSFRLDSGEFHTPWGRVFLDACIPRETAVRVTCATFDEPPPDVEVLAALAAPGRSPHRRETGPEWPWVRPPEGGFATYELPADQPPGRYLWVRLTLTGNTRSTPRVRSLRAEHPGHDYLARLPKVFSRDAAAASFLTRYLAMFEGVLGDLEARADARHVLLDARSAPADALPWLAGFLGLVLDTRWPEAVRRTLISEAAWLFRYRGTVPGLTRFLEVVAGGRVLIVEKFRLRGTGVATAGGAGPLASTSVVGGGFRVGGAVGRTDTTTVGGTAADAFETHAHRFAVVIPGEVCDSTLDMVRHVLEVHRPAHTAVEVCTPGAGIRLGVGSHLDLTTVVGRGGAFRPWRVGESPVGRGTIVGTPEPGTVPGASRLGTDSRVG